jgi:hypothetical protein
MLWRRMHRCPAHDVPLGLECRYGGCVEVLQWCCKRSVVVSAVARCTVLVDGGSRLKRSEAARYRHARLFGMANAASKS